MKPKGHQALLECLDIAVSRYTRGSMSLGDVNRLIMAVAGLDNVIELGTNAGTTTRLLSKVCQAVATVDVFEDIDKIDDEGEREFYRTNFGQVPHTLGQVKAYLSDCPNVTLCHGKTLDMVGLFDDESADAVFIDADHSYQGVSGDFEAYLPKVKTGGLIIFHDVIPAFAVFDFVNNEIAKDTRVLYKHIPTDTKTTVRVYVKEGK